MTEKQIKLSDNRMLCFNIQSEYAYDTYTISEYVFDNEDLEKSYTLSMWDDYGFNTYVKDYENCNCVNFDFDVDHPLYFPLLHLLMGDKCLIIDDDHTLEINQKYLEIKMEEDFIKLSFINNLEERIDCEKFNIFIKNILLDGRSKIDQQNKNTKNRLHNFFVEVKNLLLEEYHQISFEEYYEKSIKKVKTIY